MLTAIKISDVKSIVSMTFPMPHGGVFVLTGENGSGKTTLLACLVRIGQPDSFPRHFRTSKFSKKLDLFSEAQITYECQNHLDTVTYTYSGYRWEPTPKKNGPNLLANSGFSEVLYVAADDARVTPRQEDFRTNRIKNASAFIRSNANTVFGTTKFDGLRIVNVKKGPGQQAFVLEVDPGEFVSEKNFSLGELAIVKLLRELESAQQAALVVIDELELALHPVAQERLMQVLRLVAEQKQLTVIFSTHSATLIRATKPSRLLFLEKSGGGVVSCISGCYPSYALGKIGPTSDVSPEIVLLVEDIHAQLLIYALLRAGGPVVFPQGGGAPTVVCHPIGGWQMLLRFFDRGVALFGTISKVRAVLDIDAKPYLVPPAGHPQGAPFVHPHTPPDVRNIYNNKQAGIRFLPATPELGLVNEIAGATANCLHAVSLELMNNAVLGIPGPVGVGVINDPGARKQAKTQIDGFVARIVNNTGRSEADVMSLLFRWYVQRLEAAAPGTAASWLGALL